MSEKVLKVLSNVAQGLTETQKAQARSNIGCAGSYTAGTGITINDHSIINTAPNVKSDWTAAAGTSAEILNKPSIGNGTLTIQKNGSNVATFSANQSGNVTANITGVGGTDVVTRNNGQGGYVETSVSKLTLDTDFNQIIADNNEIGVFAPTPTLAATDKVLTVTAGSDAPVWTDKTKIVTRSSPYTTDVDITRMSIFDPGQSYGSVVQDQNSNTIGYFVPKYSAPADLGKVLTVVNDSGYRCEWRDPTGGLPEIVPMGQTTVYLSNQPEYLTMEANVAYWLETTTGGSFTVYLGTQSTTTIHNKIYLVGTQSNCVTMTIVYEDEAGQVQQLNFVYGDSTSDTVYALDVFARKVTIGEGNQAYDTCMCRVYDYPCQNRDYFSSDNNNIGLVVNYVEPL